ncbi:MAG: hypothetical protein IBJ00_00170 [Alphaproteobacteria bacterium]|nr:hypothetical protein [Alphaproteobacteria bacterium]
MKNLEHVIFLFIHENKPAEALIRTEVSKKLLLKQGALSKKFVSFRANVLAFNCYLKEEKRIAAVKKEAKERKKRSS